MCLAARESLLPATQVGPQRLLVQADPELRAGGEVGANTSRTVASGLRLRLNSTTPPTQQAPPKWSEGATSACAALTN